MIQFRNLADGIPDHWERGAHWYVEYHDDLRRYYYPLGIAFVVASEHQANLDAIFVFDEFRRHQIGTRLIRACRRRWPEILLSPSVHEFAAYIDSKTGRVPSQAQFACGEGRWFHQ